MTGSPYPDFSGKVAVVYVDIGGFMPLQQHGWVLQNVRFEDQAGRLFLVGNPLRLGDQPAGWTEGSTVNIAWGSVTHYLVYESAEAYARAIGNVPPTQFGPETPAGAGFWGKILGKG